LEGIKAFKYVLNAKGNAPFSNKNSEQIHEKLSFYSNVKKGPILIIGDKFGYLCISDLNGLVLEKEKIFNSQI
jgi:hypothetical protein